MDAGRVPRALSRGYADQVADAAERSALSSLGRLIMLTLARRADEVTGELDDRSPSLAELTRLAGAGRSTVARELARLEESGWLIRQRPADDAQRVRRQTYYAVRMPGRQPVMPDLGQSVTCPAPGPVTSDQSKRRKLRSRPTEGVQRCPVCHQPVAANDGSCGCEARR